MNAFIPEVKVKHLKEDSHFHKVLIWNEEGLQELKPRREKIQANVIKRHLGVPKTKKR